MFAPPRKLILVAGIALALKAALIEQSPLRGV